MSDALFSHPIRVDRVPPKGKHVRLEANEEERRAVAEALGIVSIAALVAEADIRRLAGDAVGVRGMLTAEVVQTDVVTLEPLPQNMAEDIDVTLMPAEKASGRSKKGETGVAPVEERDVYRNGQIDLGVIAVEHLALGLDPYPRAAGVEFPGHTEDDAAATGSPFAALQQLKRDRQ